MSEKKHIFLSYSHTDREFTNSLRENLSSHTDLQRISTWIDSERIRAGSDWRDEIDEAIKNSFLLVVVMSSAARSSEYVTYEWSFAIGAGIKVIPVLKEKIELHSRLSSTHYLDFTEDKHPLGDLAKEIKRIYDELFPEVNSKNKDTLLEIDDRLRIAIEELLTNKDTEVTVDEFIATLAKNKFITPRSYALLQIKMRDQRNTQHLMIDSIVNQDNDQDESQTDNGQ